MSDKITLKVSKAVWLDLWSWAEDKAAQENEDPFIEKEKSRHFIVTMKPELADDLYNHIQYVAGECRTGDYDVGGPAMVRAYYAAERSIGQQLGYQEAL